jgi:hypothetical protein
MKLSRVRVRAREAGDAAARPTEAARHLPTPVLIRQYFMLRRPADLGRGFSPDALKFNDATWNDIVAGKPFQTTPYRQSEVVKPTDGSSEEAASVTHFSPAPEAHGCEGCGTAFRRTRPWSRFCSAACKQRAYRKRVHASLSSTPLAGARSTAALATDRARGPCL